MGLLRWVVVLLFLLRPLHAAAQELPLIVEVDACGAALPPDRVGDAVGLELLELGEEAHAYVERTRPRVSLRCEDGELTIELSTSEGLVHREVLSVDRVGLVRFVAIAIAEDVAAQANAPPAPTVAPPAPTPPSADARSAIELRGGARIEGTPTAVGPTAELALAVAVAPWLTFEPSLEVGYASTASSLGTVERTLAALGVALRLGFGDDTWRLEGGIALRGGIAVWTGTPSDPSSLAGATSIAAWLGPAAQLLGAVHLVREVRFTLLAEAGASVIEGRGVGPNAIAASLGPGWLAIRIGVGVFFE